MNCVTSLASYRVLGVAPLGEGVAENYLTYTSLTS